MSEKSNQNHINGKKALLIIVGSVLVVVAALLGLKACGSGTGGATLGTYDGKTREEVMAELEAKARESMMEISLDVTPELSKDGSRLEVRVQNSESNKFSQSVTVMQDDEEVGSYGEIKPGEKLDEVEVRGLVEGPAEVVIRAIDPETGQPKGSASAFEVEVHVAE